MKVRMNVSIAGHPEPRYGINSLFSFVPGEVVDLHPDLAKAWLDNGHASPVKAGKAEAKAAAGGAEASEGGEA